MDNSQSPLQNYLAGMDDAQLQTLQDSGQLSPDIVNTIKAGRAPMRQAPADPVQNAANDADAAQLAANLQAGTGVLTSGPSPTQVSNLQMQTETPRAAEILSQSMDAAGLRPPSVPAPNAPLQPGYEPKVNEQEVQAVADAQATQMAAQSAAAKTAAVEHQRAQAESDRLQEEAQKKDLQLTQAVQKDIDSTPSIGQSIAQAIAIMLGAYSQGLTGAKTNPALDMLEKQLEREAARKKYDQEQKDKQFEQALKLAQLKLDEKKARSASVAENRKIDIMQAQLGMKLQEVQAKTRQNSMVGKLEYTPEEVAQMGGSKEAIDLRNRMVMKPNGMFAAAPTAAQKAKVDEMVQNSNEGLKAAHRMLQHVDYFGNNPIKKVFSFEEIGKTQADLQALVGLMRLPYVGPGVFQKSEQDMMRKIAGNPAALFSLDTTNKAKLRTIMAKFKMQNTEAYRQAGINVPLSQNEQLLNQARQKYPGASETELINALIKTGKWNESE